MQITTQHVRGCDVENDSGIETSAKESGEFNAEILAIFTPRLSDAVVLPLSTVIEWPSRASSIAK